MRLIANIRGQFAGRVAVVGLAGVLQVALAVAILPITTIVLTAADFGTYALMLSIVALAVSMCDAGAGLALPAHYGPASAADRRSMLATFFLVCLGLSSLMALLLLAAWPLRNFLLVDGYTHLSWTIATLSALLIPLQAVNGLATTCFSVASRGTAIALQIVGQSLATFAGTIVALRVFNLDVAALFVGAVVGQAAAAAIAAWTLGTQPWFRPARRWFALAGINAPSAATLGLADGLRGVFENAILARTVSLSAIGYLAHARLYQGMIVRLSNAVAHNAWARSLSEAREISQQFIATSRIWTPVQIGVTIFGLVSVAIGPEAISLLTNNQLTPAAELVPWFVIIALIQLSAKAAMAVIYVCGKAAQTSRFRTAQALVTIALLIPVVGHFGLAGLIALLMFESLIFRMYVIRNARLLGVRRFQDVWVLRGVLAIVVAVAANFWFQPTFEIRVLLMLIVVAYIGIHERKLLREVTCTVRVLVRPGRNSPASLTQNC